MRAPVWLIKARGFSGVSQGLVPACNSGIFFFKV